MNTISESIKELIRKSLTDDEIQQLEQQILNCASELTNSPVHAITINNKKLHFYRHVQPGTNGQPNKESYYLFNKILGSGNVGTAYRATLLNPGEGEKHQYVIKTTRITQKRLFDQFLDETWMLESAALEALHKDKAHAATDDHFRYLVMPYARGVSFKDLQQDNPITFLRSVKKALKGLEKVHQYGSHGDLKAEHIIISDESDDAEVIDLGHCGKPGQAAPQLDSAWIPAVATCPVNYMFIPDSQASSKIASQADDIYVLGSIIQKKVDLNNYLIRDKFLQEICSKMTAKTAHSRLSAEDLITKIDTYLNVSQQVASTNLNSFAQTENADELDYSKLYKSLSAYEQKERYAKLEALLDQMGTPIENSTEKNYTSLELKKIDTLKTAYKQLFEENLNTFYNPKNHNNVSIHDIETLYNTASHSRLLRQQRNRFWKTAETKSQIAVRDIYTHARNKFLSSQDTLKIDSAALKSDHDTFKAQQMNDTHYKNAITHYVGVSPQTSNQVRWFASTFLANATAAAVRWYDKFNRIEGGMYLGMLPEGDLINSTHASRIHSVISLVEWHEYLSPFPTIQPAQPEQIAKRNIVHHSIRMADWTANIDTHIAIDALFKIAAHCDAAQKEDKVVYFHCKAGKSRSAMMLALVMYHRHRYLENPPDYTYTIEKAYKQITKHRHQIDIDKSKKQAIDRIVKALDSFYANKATVPTAASPAPLAPSVTSPAFVWDNIAQLPAFKTLLIMAQKLVNENAAHPDYVQIFKPFFDKVAQGTMDWYNDLKSDTPQDDVLKLLKGKFTTEVDQLLGQIDKKISPAIVEERKYELTA